MFQTEEEIRRRTPAGSLDRRAHLQQLVTEFQTTESQACKYEVLANLANFAYDPMNYGHLKRLNVADLFLDMLSEEDDKLVEFGIGGLCNLALDKELKVFILQNDGVSQVKQCLASPNTEIIISAITTLMFLTTPSSKQEICCEETVAKIVEFCQSENKKISNLAHIFMEAPVLQSWFCNVLLRLPNTLVLITVLLRSKESGYTARRRVKQNVNQLIHGDLCSQMQTGIVLRKRLQICSWYGSKMVRS
ncbi:Armadillo repeat-containing protein 7 [Holothuria leucospilota]|uniref:Armadillo repeat-containing protein 7 n=1 Tax=Holothuria leucospilota TaxID=206669 RepID=A0A9Q1H8Z6_HOLLE|nr:Armadillo repeat-containing protein 7 [Holothuria leucospilota]